MFTNLRRWLLTGLLGLALWPGEAGAQSPELRGAYERARELYTQGRYQEAIPFAKEAVRLDEQEFGLDHPRTATALNNLGALYQAQGRYSEAISGRWRSMKRH